MKLFEKENGNEVVYVQLQDLGYLNNECDMPVPLFVVKVLLNVGRIDQRNRFDFVKFNREEEVKFFKRLNFIIDYGKFENLTEEEIYAKETELYDTLKLIKQKSEKIDEEAYFSDEIAKAKFDCLYNRHVEIEYQLKWIKEIYNIRLGITKMNFPNSHGN